MKLKARMEASNQADKHTSKQPNQQTSSQLTKTKHNHTQKISAWHSSGFRKVFGESQLGLKIDVSMARKM